MCVMVLEAQGKEGGNGWRQLDYKGQIDKGAPVFVCWLCQCVSVFNGRYLF